MERKKDLVLRERTEEFMILRRAAIKQQQWMGKPSTPPAEGDEDASASGGGKEAADVPQPHWVGCLERCRDLEATIRSRIERLHTEQHKSFSHKFSMDEDEEKEAARKAIDKQSSEIAKLLKELERMVKTGVKPSAEANPDEQRAALGCQKHLVTNLNVLVNSFKDGQTLYAEQVKRHDAKAKKFQNLGTTEVQERLEREDRIAEYMEMGYSQVEIQELLTLDQQAQEQNNEVQAILASVKELHEMFTEMNDLIMEQGTVLDRIDYNLTSAVKKLDKGNEQLKKAREHQKKCTLS